MRILFTGDSRPLYLEIRGEKGSALDFYFPLSVFILIHPVEINHPLNQLLFFFLHSFFSIIRVA